MTQKYFSILHRNIRSLSKNLNLLEELLCSLDSKLNILGITETKLGEKSISNVNIKGYNIFHPDSPNNAGFKKECKLFLLDSQAS